MSEGVGIEVEAVVGTIEAVVVLLGKSGLGGVGDESFVIGVSDGITGGWDGGNDEVDGGTVLRGETSSKTALEREDVAGARGDGEGT